MDDRLERLEGEFADVEGGLDSIGGDVREMGKRLEEVEARLGIVAAGRISVRGEHVAIAEKIFKECCKDG